MTIKRLTFVVAVLLISTFAAPTRAQKARTLDISFNDGRVTLIADNVTLREILQEWARKGGSNIVNVGEVTGDPVLRTEFDNQPEADVLRTLLREVPGYGASMRAVTETGASAVAAIYIVATRSVAAIPSGFSQPSAPTVAPVMDPAAFGPEGAPRLIQGSPDNEIPPVRPIFDGPPMTPEAPQQSPANPNLRVGPGGVVTSTVPGVIIPVQPAGGAGSAPPTPTSPTGGRGRGGGGGGATQR